MEHIVGIGGFALSGNQSDMIKTFALSTCVALVYYSMRKHVMGMSHIQLPIAQNWREGDQPSRYADLAPEHLLSEMKKFGVGKSELLVSLYGGIDSSDPNDCFRIGEKNIASVKTALRSLGLVYSDVDTGGNDSRTLMAYVSNGVVEVVRRPMAFRSGASRARNDRPLGFGNVR